MAGRDPMLRNITGQLLERHSSCGRSGKRVRRHDVRSVVGNIADALAAILEANEDLGRPPPPVLRQVLTDDAPYGLKQRWPYREI